MGCPHSSIIDGYVVIHLDMDAHNDDISNLKAITRAELLKRNRNNKI
jgi:hypothetical protein